MVRRGWPAVLGGLLAAVCPAVLFATAGPLGGAVGTVAFAGWLLSPMYGFAVGQAGLLLVATVDTPLLRLAGMEGALFLLLIAGLIRQWTPVEVPVFLLTVTALAGGVGAGVYSGVPTLQLAAALLGAIAISAYALHRYELMAMGLVGEVAE